MLSSENLNDEMFFPASSFSKKQLQVDTVGLFFQNVQAINYSLEGGMASKRMI